MTLKPRPNVVVIGAGVSGLTSALVLARLHPDFQITVLAKHMPGDYDIEYCSPWAGANFNPMNPADSRAGRFERESWKELSRLAREEIGAGIHFQRSVKYIRASDLLPDQTIEEALKEKNWLADVVPEYRHLNPSELPEGFIGGISYQSICINTPLYLSHLHSQCLTHHITFHRTSTLPSLSSITPSHHHPDIIINCTGLGSLALTDVNDEALYPVRGQIVLVRNGSGNLMRSATAAPGENPDESFYVMTRAAGGGTVVGGCRQEGNWDGRVDVGLAGRIMERAVRLCPDLVGEGGVEGLDVVRHWVGLRPERKGRVRVELERREGGSVVHNYGHGGYGYQSSYGCAYEVERLVVQGLRSPDEAADGK